MTEMGRRSGGGDMLKSVYDPNLDGVIALAQTQADMTKAVYDPVVAAIQALAAAHKTQHQNGGTDEINATGLTGIPVAPLLGDGTPGRVLRFSSLSIQNGTDPDTLKCTLSSRWNGDVIPTQDNVALDATTGHFKVNAPGRYLTILNTGLTGNMLFTVAHFRTNATNTIFLATTIFQADGILCRAMHPSDGTYMVLTDLVNVGDIVFDILYVTDA